MTSETTTPQMGGDIREQYEEYDVGESRIGMITDPDNEYAWIWSDTVQPAKR